MKNNNDIIELTHQNDTLGDANGNDEKINLLKHHIESQQELDYSDYVSVDVHKMRQVVRNLVSNAVKFTPAGKSVTLRLRKTSEKLPIKVIDSTEPVLQTAVKKKSFFENLF